MAAVQRLSNTLLLLLVTVMQLIMMLKSSMKCYAFASSNHYTRNKFLSASRRSSSLASYWGANVRGGDPRLPTPTTTTTSATTTNNSGRNSNTPLFSSSSSSSSNSDSTSPSTTTTDEKGQSSMIQLAKECLEIAGSSSMERKSFGGIPYLESSSSSSSGGNHENTNNKYRVIFVLGGPGAGKGTQSELLLQNYPCVHLSAGELLREETTKPNSVHGPMIEECLVKGQIVPVEISLSLLQSAMKTQQDISGQSLVFLVDGFPRNFDNLQGWTKCMKDVAIVWGAMIYQCPLSVLETRILLRSKDSGRSDDNLNSLRKRFTTFEQDTVPVIDTLRLIQEQTYLTVADIRGDQSLEEVWNDTQSCMNQFLTNDILSSNAQLLHAIATGNRNEYEQLCADELLLVDGTEEESSSTTTTSASTKKSPVENMMEQEGDHKKDISNANLEFISGTKAAVSYDRVVGDVTFREKRIWSHQGLKGWRMVHFSRMVIDAAP